jgi:simple sugar transport system permease protein
MSAVIKKIGIPRLIIASFLLLLFILGPFFNVKTSNSFNDVMLRFGMNGVIVLSMMPMIKAGCGLNFGVPVGIVAGLIGSVITLELGMSGFIAIFTAMFIGVVAGALVGFIYGQILNRVKGDEMIISTYIGYSFIFFMNMLWIILPFRNPSSVQGFKGEGLRVTISLDNYYIHQLNDFLSIRINDNLSIPTGMLIFFFFICFLMWLFFKSKLGSSIIATGLNPKFAEAAGVNINKMRLTATIISTVLAAVGIIVYQQSFGFIQMYNAPTSFAFPTVAAALLGGASVRRISIPNVIMGALLFQGILTMTPAVINNAIAIDISEIIRIMISNGMIVYALTRKESR